MDAKPLENSVSPFRTLSAASAVLLSDLDPRSVLSKVLDLARTLLAADGYAVWRIRNDHGHVRWRIEAQHGLSEFHAAKSIETASSYRPPTEPFVVENIDDHTDLRGRERLLHEEGIQCILVVPLVMRGSAQGTITYYFRARRRVTPEEIEYASTLSNIAAAALATSELYQAQIASRRRAALLAEVTALFNNSLHLETTLQHVAKAVVPGLADWCAISLLRDDKLERVAVYHSDPAQLRLADELSRDYPEQLTPERGAGWVLRKMEPEIVTGIKDEMIVAAAQSERHLALIRALQIHGLITMPLIQDGAAIGILRLVSAESRRDFDDSDLALASQIADRAAVAIGNSRLFSALEESEARFRGMFENSVSPMVLTRLDGTITSANRAYCELTGHTQQELRDRRFDSITHPEDRDTNLEEYREMLVGKRPSVVIEKRYMRKDGGVVWVNASASLLRDKDGTPLQVIGVLEDISARKHAEAESARLLAELKSERLQLQATVEQLRMIEAAVNAGTWMFDAKTGISHWPPGVSALWGLEPFHHQIDFESFVERIHAEDRERVGGVVRKSLETGDRYEVEFRVIWPDQSVHWLSARGAVMRDENGAPSKIIGIALEVTQRVKAEEVMLRTEKLAAVGRLAASISHEINNPLEAVTNLLFLLRTAPELSPESKSLVDTAEQELARVSHIATQTLRFYRQASNPACVPASELVNSVLSLFRGRLRQAGVRVVCRHSDDDQLQCFAGELRQVITNLVSNALDASRDGTLYTRTRRVSHPQLGDAVRITVADTGHGIEERTRKHLFEPFYTTKGLTGTGLGLWVSKEIIDKHNGRLRLRSSTHPRHHGTVFHIYLPVAAASSAANNSN
jgi:PAS domain S-box-containing protein